MKTFLLRVFYFLSAIIPEKFYLRVVFYLRTGYKLNLKNPKTFNEKLQWLKVNYRDWDYVKLVDKYAVKEYVTNKVGSQYVIPNLGLYKNTSEIDWKALPNQFVMKVTHDSGGVIVCKDKSTFDIEKAVKKLTHDLHRRYWKYTREWPYKYTSPRILCEVFINQQDASKDLLDYKFFCFDGVPRLLYVASNRSSGVANFDFFDLDFNRLDVKNGHPNSKEKLEKPENFQEMIDVAASLSKGMPHVRVDLYNVDGHIYFGEMTFFHMSGMVSFVPHEFDIQLGNMLVLPNKNRNNDNKVQF